MKANRVPRDAGRSQACLLIVLSIAVFRLVIMPGFAASRLELPENVPQRVNKINISVQDGRPVAKAIMILEAKYGWVITYEDPRYVHADDIADVTEKVRRDLHKYPRGRAPKVLVPKGGALSFDYDDRSQTKLPRDPGVVVQQLLIAQAASANGGKFRMEKGDNIIHVIPTAIKASSGKLAAHKSVLDAVITLPPKERNGLQALEAVCAAVSKATQTRVMVGTIPLNLFLQHKVEHGARSRKARQALVQLLQNVNHGMNLSWQLFYDPGMKIYVLNIHTSKALSNDV